MGASQSVCWPGRSPLVGELTLLRLGSCLRKSRINGVPVDCENFAGMLEALCLASHFLMALAVWRTADELRVEAFPIPSEETESGPEGFSDTDPEAVGPGCGCIDETTGDVDDGVTTSVDGVEDC